MHCKFISGDSISVQRLEHACIQSILPSRECLRSNLHTRYGGSHFNHTVPAPTNNFISHEIHTIHLVRMACQVRLDFIGLQVPNLTKPRKVRIDDEKAIWPDLYSPILPTTDKPPSIRTPRRPIHPCDVSAEGRDVLACPAFPHAHGGIPRRRGGPPAVWRKGDVRDLERVSRQSCEGFGFRGWRRYRGCRYLRSGGGGEGRPEEERVII